MKRSPFIGASVGLIFTMLFIDACQKKKQPEVSSPHELTKTEFFNSVAGHYKVFDSIGDYIYEMDIIHIAVDELTDSLRFENFDGRFSFTSRQSHPNLYPNYIGIGGGDSLRDTNNNRWKLYGPSFLDYNNLHNDTINLRFEKTNINYYIEDATPYYSCDCKQIAVKQH